jgi:DNA topoisomerase-1
VYDQTTVLVDGTSSHHHLGLKTVGSQLRFDGWMKLFPNQGDVILPANLTEHQPLTYQEAQYAQKFTQPPPRFNDASLIKTLESEGIGRPSTYASIISVLEDRGYVERKEKKFFPTAIGTAVCGFLMQHFADMMDYAFTAMMEDDLDAISRGEKVWTKIVAEFYTPLEKQVTTAIDKAERAKIPTEKTGESCPKCGTKDGGEVVIRTGRYGKFRSCSRFPECDFTEQLVEKLPGVLCPLCQQGEVVIKPSRYGKSFFGCVRYPECSWASWKKPIAGERVTQEAWDIQQKERAERKARMQKEKGESASAPKGTPIKRASRRKKLTKRAQ